ncbi:hypothetical protein PIROE2DRAFT_13584, partial [Piromyces sp. E2]
EEFKKDDLYTIGKLYNEGISGSCFGGSNVAANKYSDQEKQEAALTVIEYITSKDIQKEFVMKYNYLSGIYSLYDDVDVCNKIDCELYNSIQPTIRPTNENEDYDEYSEEFRRQIYKYIYDNTDVKDALQGAIDIKKIYHISLDIFLEWFVFIILCVIIVVIVISLIIIFIPSLKSFFEFLPNDLWIISLFGIIMINCISFTEYGEITVFICHLRLFLLAFGFTLNMIPILYKLIINFPDESKVSCWIKEHRYSFILIFLFIDLFMNLILFTSPYKVSEVRVIDGKNFKYCLLDNIYSKLIEAVFSLIKIIVFLSIFSLIFLEWNLSNTYYDVRFMITAVYIDALDFILILLVNIFKIDNYRLYFLIRVFVFIIYAISTYVFFFGYRIIYYLIYNIKGSKENINNISDTIRKQNFQSNSKNINQTSTLNSSSYKTTNGMSKFMRIVLSYHYRKESKKNNTSSTVFENIENNSNYKSNNSQTKL